MPELEGAAEILLGTWLRRPGDRVAAGDVVAEAQTDKVNVEIESPVTGVVEELLVPEGATVSPATVLAKVRQDSS
jgi:2-oxoglutarate dehydrogenase E2 component (dihydrolipoamide succinyltransferase)